MGVFSTQELSKIKKNADLVFDTAQIEAAVKKVSLRLDALIENENAIILCVMNGGLVFTADLVRFMSCDTRLDYLQVARYRDKTIGGDLYWHKEPQLSLQGQTVVIVDDIYDEGYTMAELASYCHIHGAKKVISVVLLLKQKPLRKTEMRPDIYGLEVSDRYVFGYGMDYKGHLRNVPAIYAIEK